MQSIRRWIVSLLLLVSLALAGALLGYPQAANAAEMRAIATIKGTGISGQLTLTESAPGVVQVRASVNGDPKVLAAGPHGFHLHEVGVCDETTSTRFSSAKGHFDPGPSGSSTPVEKNHPYHLGDLPNIEVNNRGTGRLQTITTRVSLSASPVSLLDTNGTAIILHQRPDLMKAGGTAEEAGGGRLACGVLEKA